MKLKSYFIVVPLFLFSILINGCGGSRMGGKVPDWVNKPPKFQDGYAAIGISSPGLPQATARTQADARARVALAQQMETRVRALTEDWLKASTTLINGESNISTASFTEQVSKNVTKAVLVGTVPDEYHTAPDGTVYCLMVMKKDAALPAAKQQIFDEALKYELINRVQMEAAQERLEQAIQKEYGQTVEAVKSRQ